MSVPKVKNILLTEFIKKAGVKNQPFKTNILPEESKELHKSLFRIINTYESSIVNRERCHLMSSDTIELV